MENKIKILVDKKIFDVIFWTNSVWSCLDACRQPLIDFKIGYGIFPFFDKVLNFNQHNYHNLINMYLSD